MAAYWNQIIFEVFLIDPFLRRVVFEEVRFLLLDHAGHNRTKLSVRIGFKDGEGVNRLDQLAAFRQPYLFKLLLFSGKVLLKV